MTGYNHYSNCTCGWCIGGWRNHGSRPAPPRSSSWNVRWTYESFTIPNAACPVCGASVFFYQSPYGGRVFFNDLGPPWPKHGCTDNSPPPTGRVVKPQKVSPPARPTPAWKVNDWTPIGVDRVYREDEWYVLKCHRLDDDTFFRLLSPEAIEDIVRAPTFLSPMTDDGFAMVSFLARDGSPREALVYDYGTHCLSSPDIAVHTRCSLSNGTLRGDPTIAPVDGS